MKLITIIFIGLLITAGLVYSLSQRPLMGREIERWETTNHTIKIRVTAHPEEGGGFVGGAYYVFQSAREGEVNWREIMTVRHDPIKIPREGVKFIGDQVGYVFMLYNYGVTVDGGVTWYVWRAPQDLPNWRQTRANIDDVRIFPDGTGIMTLRSSTDQVAPELHTNDYGKHWNLR